MATRKFIEEVGESSYISVVTGFWYEYSLGIAGNYGFDFAKREVVFYDEGETRISTSTWPQVSVLQADVGNDPCSLTQVGRAVASLLSLPIHPEEGSKVCLSDFRNQLIYVNSFNVSQQDMLESVMRVTNTTEADWTIVKKSSSEQYATGMKDMKEGKKPSANFLYARVFYPGPEGGGDFEHSRGTSNAVLGLPKEGIDEATRVAMDRQAAGSGH